MFLHLSDEHDKLFKDLYLTRLRKIIPSAASVIKNTDRGGNNGDVYSNI